MRHQNYWLLGLLGVMACASDTEPLVSKEPKPPLTENQSTYYLPGIQPQIWLFVVDNDASTSAQLLREQVASALQLPDGGPYVGESLCAGDDYDPTREDPIDIRVAIASPTGGSPLRLVTPAENPALARLGERDDMGAHHLWLSAVRDELLTAPEASAEQLTVPYTPLDTLAAFVSLLTGERLPRSLQEAEQLNALAPGEAHFTTVFLATTRDDTSPMPVENYDVTSYNNLAYESLYFTEIRILGSPIQSFPRLRQYLTQDDEFFATTWYDTAEDFYRPTLFDKTGFTKCFPRSPIRHKNGAVDCTLKMVTPDLTDCNTALGRRDPLTGRGNERAPLFETTDSGETLRICELVQLEDDALERCLHPDGAPQYQAGWCYPKPSETCRQLVCGSKDGFPSDRFRFIGGNTRTFTAGAMLRVDCQLQPNGS